MCPTQHYQSYFPHGLRNSTDRLLRRGLTAGAREGGREAGAEKSRHAGVLLSATRSFEGCVQGCVRGDRQQEDAPLNPLGRASRAATTV